MIAVIEPGNTDAYDDTAEYTHLQRHDAAGAGNRTLQDIRGNRAVGQNLAGKLQYGVAGNMHDKKSNHGRECGDFFLGFCHADCNTDGKDDRQVAKDRTAGAAHDGEQCMEECSITEQAFETIHFDGCRVGEGAADTEQETCNRQDCNRQHETAADTLQYAKNFVFHKSVLSFVSGKRKKGTSNQAIPWDCRNS